MMAHPEPMQSNKQAHPTEHFEWQSKLIMNLITEHACTIGSQHLLEIQRKTASAAELSASFVSPDLLVDCQAYVEDYIQRSILFMDTLRKRGNAYIERANEGFKPALAFDYDIIMDGRQLERAVNYTLVRIHPPQGYPPQRENSRPFVIVDPRAGHGSGIGGFKAESEVGVALKDGHPVYFLIFYPDPEPDQTLADICNAEAEFLREVQRRHPGAPAPLVVGNCQGGWASMILSATHPDLTGPVVIAGAPLSYWSGELGKKPFRYLGGIAGGAIPALFASDLGGGKFDGAGLVLNFEQLNPGRTWWRKYYDLFDEVDARSAEFLKFENWWSVFYFMNENEIRWIVENLFIGNKLTRGEAVLNDGTPVDLTAIRAPIIVFASHGDNITSPQQALNWIPDLYVTTEEIRARGHVIIYTLHDSIGHLGIFVSAKVATKQHKQITSVVKTIEALPPGLYEMLISGTDDRFEVAFEARTVDDILSLGGGREEEEEFAAVAKVSEWATHSYELSIRPAIQAMVTPQTANAFVHMQPIRQRRYMFSDNNPLMPGIGGLAEQVRANRKPVNENNPFRALERLQADWIEQSLDMLRDSRDAMIEIAFHAIYATPWMRAVANHERCKPGRLNTHDIAKFPAVRQAIEKVAAGGYREAIVRMLILLAHARGGVRRDRLERSNKMLHCQPPFDSMLEDERSRLIHEQGLIVQFAPNEAVSSLPALLRDDVDRIRALNIVLSIAGPPDEMDPTTIAMFKRLQTVLCTYARDWRDPSHVVEGHEPGSPPQNKALTDSPREQAASEIATHEQTQTFASR